MKSTIILIITFLCFVQNSLAQKNDHFQLLINGIQDIKFPFTINDTTVFNDWDGKFLIDTNYVKEFNLIRYLKDTSITLYPLSNISDYKFSSIGKYLLDSRVILLFKCYTTEAGNGGAVVILVVFNQEGKKVDERVMLSQDAEDAYYIHRSELTFKTGRRIFFKSIIKINVLEGDDIKPKKITKKESSYTIERNGRIKRLSFNSKVVYENKYLKDDL